MQNKRIPNLIIPGVPKAGTSALFNYLTQHPDIFRSKVKEPHTYTFTERYAQRNKEGKYSFSHLYQDYKDQQYIVDASTTYMISELAIERIINEGIDHKFIIVLRDPIERIESHYNWLNSMGLIDLNFEDEITFWLKEKFDPQVKFEGNFKNYVEFSMYGKQLKSIFDKVKKENILVVNTYDLKFNTHSLLERIFEFLGIPKYDGFIVKTINKTPQSNKVTRSWVKSLRPIKKYLPKRFRTILSKANAPLQAQKRSIKLNIDQKKWLFEFLKDDIEYLESFGFVFHDWNYLNEARS